MPIDRKRASSFAIGALAATFVFFFKTSLLDPGVDLANIVATIFSVMAGFLSVALNLVAISRPGVFKSKISQRKYMQLVQSRVRRHNWLFYLYLVILICVFISELCLKKHPFVGHLFESLYLSLSAAALIWSFSIPTTIVALQNEHAQLALLAQQRD